MEQNWCVTKGDSLKLNFAANEVSPSERVTATMTPKVEGIHIIFEGVLHHGLFYLIYQLCCLDWLPPLLATWP